MNTLRTKYVILGGWWWSEDNGSVIKLERGLRALALPCVLRGQNHIVMIFSYQEQPSRFVRGKVIKSDFTKFKNREVFFSSSPISVYSRMISKIVKKP